MKLCPQHETHVTQSMGAASLDTSSKDWDGVRHTTWSAVNWTLASEAYKEVGIRVLREEDFCALCEMSSGAGDKALGKALKDCKARESKLARPGARPGKAE